MPALHVPQVGGQERAERTLVKHRALLRGLLRTRAEAHGYVASLSISSLHNLLYSCFDLELPVNSH